MKVAVLGGAGKMGGAVARHLSKNHQVIIGSRDPARAREQAKLIRGAEGLDYEGAAKACDVAVVSIPYRALAVVSPLADALAGKLVVSMVNPTKLEAGIRRYGLERGSAAEELAALLPKSRIATAFNNVPVAMMEMEEVVPMDVLVAASSREAYDETADLLRSVGNVRPLYAGPLSEAQVVERITPLVLNLAKMNGTGSLTTKFISQDG